MELNTTLNKHYAVGFHWKMVTSPTKTPQQTCKLTKSLGSPYICVVRRKGQLGFANGSKEWIGRPSLASAFAAAGGTHLWISHTDTHTWWICAIKDGFIVPDGDYIANTADSAIEHALFLQENFDLPDVEFCSDTTQLNKVLQQRIKGKKFLLLFSNRVQALNPPALFKMPALFNISAQFKMPALFKMPARFNISARSRIIFGGAISTLLMISIASSTGVITDNTYPPSIQQVVAYFDTNQNPSSILTIEENEKTTSNYLQASKILASTVLGIASASENINIAPKSITEFKAPSLLSNSWHQANNRINTRVTQNSHTANIEESKQNTNSLLTNVAIIQTAQATTLQGNLNNNTSSIKNTQKDTSATSVKSSLKNTPMTSTKGSLKNTTTNSNTLLPSALNSNKSPAISKGKIKKEKPVLIASNSTKQKENTLSISSFTPGTLGHMLKLRAELEQINMQVELEEARRRLNKLLYVEEKPTAIATARPSLAFPPIGMPSVTKTLESKIKNTVKPFRILSIQSVKGKYTAIVGTNSGAKKVKVNDVIFGRRVVSISRNTVVMNRGQGNETLTIQD